MEHLLFGKLGLNHLGRNMKIECDLVEKYRISIFSDGDAEVLYDDTPEGVYEKYLHLIYGPVYNGNTVDLLMEMDHVQVIAYDNHYFLYKVLSDICKNAFYEFPYKNVERWSILIEKLREEMYNRIRLETTIREQKQLQQKAKEE